MMEREPALAQVLPRQPGTKEARFIHLLGEEQPVTETPSAESVVPAARASSRVEELERDVAELRQEIADLRQQFAEFKKQFEG
jgi:uncharacterized protein YceH (UPF0502 family)